MRMVAAVVLVEQGRTLFHAVRFTKRMGQRGLVMVFVADVVCNILTPLSGDRYVGTPKTSYCT